MQFVLQARLFKLDLESSELAILAELCWVLS